MEEIIVTNEMNVTFKNKSLNSATKKIVTLVNKTKKSLIEIATILNTVYENKSYKDDGFENIAEYTEKCFGFKKVFTYNLININKFIGDNGECLIPNEYSTEYSASQLQELIPLDLDIVSELAEIDEINPLMTTKEIREIVKDLKSKNNSETSSEETSSEETSSEETSSEETPYKIVTKVEFRKEITLDGNTLYYVHDYTNNSDDIMFETFSKAMKFLENI